MAPPKRKPSRRKTTDRSRQARPAASQRTLPKSKAPAPRQRRRDITKLPSRPSTAPRRPRQATETAPPDDGVGVRLQKALAAAGVGSRRLCEQLIERGEVRVNGRVVNRLPAWVDPATDELCVHGQVLPRPERHVYVMLYKPRHTVSTLSDPAGRRTVSDIVQHPSGARLYPVGRLDYDTLGLLILTNDGELANRLTHPRYGVHKTYRAVVRGALTDEKVAALERGIYLAERKAGRTLGAQRTGGATLTLVKSAVDRSVIDITLSEGRNRQVRRMLASVGCLVKKLVRISMGPIRLRSVALGQWRELTREEVKALRVAAGLARADPAHARRRAASDRVAPDTPTPLPRRSEDDVNLILPPPPGIRRPADDDDDLAGDDVW